MKNEWSQIKRIKFYIYESPDCFLDHQFTIKVVQGKKYETKSLIK